MDSQPYARPDRIRKPRDPIHVGAAHAEQQPQYNATQYNATLFRRPSCRIDGRAWIEMLRVLPSHMPLLPFVITAARR